MFSEIVPDLSGIYIAERLAFDKELNRQLRKTNSLRHAREVITLMATDLVYHSANYRGLAMRSDSVRFRDALQLVEYLRDRF